MTLVWGDPQYATDRGRVICRAPGVAIAVLHDAPPLASRALRLVYGPREPTLVVDAHAHRAHLRELLARPRLRGRGLPFWAPHVEEEEEGESKDSSSSVCCTCFAAPAARARPGCGHGACALHARALCYHAAHRRNVVEAFSPMAFDLLDVFEEDEPVYCARESCPSVASALLPCPRCACTRYCTTECMDADALDHFLACSMLTTSSP
jgi:hypothetical protein